MDVVVRSTACPYPSTKIALLKDMHMATFCLFWNMPSPPHLTQFPTHQSSHLNAFAQTLLSLPHTYLALRNDIFHFFF